MPSKGFAQQSILVIMVHMGAMISIFLVQVVIARMFGPDGRGVFANAFAFSGLLTMLIGTGHELANTYFIASGKQKVSEAAGSSLLGFLISVGVLSVVTFLVIYFRPSFVAFSSNRVILLAVSSVPVTWAGMYVYSLLRGMGRSDLSYVRFFITNFGWLLAMVCLCWVLSIRQIEVVFVAHLVAVFMALAVAVWFIKRLNHSLKFTFNWKSFRESMNYGVKQIFSKLANPIMLRSEMLIIPMLHVTESSLGLYAQGIAILDRVLTLPIVLGFVLLEKVSQDPKGGVNTTATLSRLSLFITFIVGLTIMSFAKPLISFLFKPEFVPAVPLMWIMFPATVLRSVPRVLQSYFQGIGQPGRVSVVFLTSLGMMIATDVVLIALMGIMGAAVGVLLSSIVEFVAMVYMFKRSTNLGLVDVCVVRLSDIALIKNSLFNLISRKGRG